MVKESYKQLLLNILYCTQNRKYYYLPEIKVCFMKKIVQYLLSFVYLFCPKISKNDSRKSFIKKLLNSILSANFCISAFNWLRINNKYDFELANRFAQRKFFKFFLTKDH